jgi:hypothetical protein
MMKKIIKKLLREQFIDGQNMSKETETLCNKMTVGSYEEVLKLVAESLKQFDDETKHKIVQKIITPLENLRNTEITLRDEMKKYGMTGDSLPDQSNTYWHQIQSTICELGKDFT